MTMNSAYMFSPNPMSKYIKTTNYICYTFNDKHLCCN